MEAAEKTEARVHVAPIINCHTHIFTGDHVPPYLARTFVPWPIYYLLSVSFVIRLFRFWYRGPYTWQFKPWYRRAKETYYQVKMAIRRNGLLRAAVFLLGLLLTLQVLLILADWFPSSRPSGGSLPGKVLGWVESMLSPLVPSSWAGRWFLVLALVLFFKSGRNLLWFLLRKVGGIAGMLPGPESKELAKRYLNIGRYSFYRHQARIFGRLRNQYPPGTAFVVLPMDLEFMEAGPLPKEHCFSQQMEVLAEMKRKPQYRDVFFPFVFADPRRIASEGETHFGYRAENGSVVLKDCFLKRYLEDYKFSGIKIYPALGYYPFDEALLPLWKYAADNGIPVLTHCIRGTIYFRGKKRKEWDHHPVFEKACGDGAYSPLPLLETKNRDFSDNFTHPLNYLCLLEERLLRTVVGQASAKSVRDLFGYVDADTPLKQNLSHLKLCFGHFGGDDEWRKFLESDRDNFTGQLIKSPGRGIEFLVDAYGKLSRGRPEQIWKTVDWYTIICSLMLQYEHVYSDISYILHSPDIQPLLKQTLANPKLRKRTLFGTDFYVVRNHKSEKGILADMLHSMDGEEFDQIAKINPKTFLLLTQAQDREI